VSDRSAGCRGVIGPVPRPLWMNTAQPRGELRHGASQSRIVGTNGEDPFPAISQRKVVENDAKIAIRMSSLTTCRGGSKQHCQD
jgi:hypothetical protein